MRWAVLKDVDGAPLGFDVDPQAVKASLTPLAMLQELHLGLGGTLALISGRELDDIDRMFRRAACAIAGPHGLQLRHA